MTDTAPPPPPPGSPTDHPPSDRTSQAPGGPSTGPFAGSLSSRTLRRSITDRKVAGVAGGLGRWLDVDPTILRVLFVVLTFFGGAGLLLYGVAWLVVPQDGTHQGTVPTGDSVRNAVLIGAVVLAALVALGADSLDGGFFPWPLFVIGLVLAGVLLGRDNRRARGVPPTPPPTAPPPTGWSASAYAPPQSGGTEPTVVLEKQPAWYPPVAPPPLPPPPPRRTGPLLFGPALALVALGLGVLGLYDATGGAVSAAAYPALALALVGLLLVVGAFVGRPGGLVLLGLVAAVALLFSAVVDPAYDGPRELELHPTSGAVLDGTYHVPSGRIELDLTEVGDPATLDGRTFDLSVGAGEVVVVVPRSVEVVYDVAVDFGGQVDVLGRTSDGWSPELSGTVGPVDPDASLTLNLAADFGHLEVVRS
jgi:phage shock protein PspC (stress-responsive transcriptional regulator)